MSAPRFNPSLTETLLDLGVSTMRMQLEEAGGSPPESPLQMNQRVTQEGEVKSEGRTLPKGRTNFKE